MTLKKFIHHYVEPNTLIRLWYKIKGGHEKVDGRSLSMSHMWVDSEYADHEVVGVTDILITGSRHPEAVNITLERE